MELLYLACLELWPAMEALLALLAMAISGKLACCCHSLSIAMHSYPFSHTHHHHLQTQCHCDGHGS